METSNENINSDRSLMSSPISYEPKISISKDKQLKYQFATPICTNTKCKLNSDTEKSGKTMFINNKRNCLNNYFFNSEVQSTLNENELKFNIPQPENPVLILEEYRLNQSFLCGSLYSNIFDDDIYSVKSKSAEIPSRPQDSIPKRKGGYKKKMVEPARVFSPRHMFPNRPYVPFDEIIGYADGYPYDHFGPIEERDKRKKIMNENPSNKIVDLLTKIQNINQNYAEKEKEIKKEFSIVEKNPVDILIVNKKKLSFKNFCNQKLPPIKIDPKQFETVFLPAPSIRIKPDHVFLRKILYQKYKWAKSIFNTTNLLVMRDRRVKLYQSADINKYFTFDQTVEEIWPLVYLDMDEDFKHEKVDVVSMLDRMIQLFSLMEEVDMKYFSELSHIKFSTNNLIRFNYNPKKLFH